ncbi:MAG: hypothetical protein IKZ81_03945 [Clostridia bacterium]|nr:hypothetical protein [Clostridia bacterium]MBR5769259.1 hypothetical protein [Clostridia bacterium]MBR5942477.1 hypothetical protein [Clostridia bacterium]
MDLIKKLWPTPFKIKKGSLVSFLVQLLIFLIICAVIGWLFTVLSKIAVVGVVFYFVGGLMGLYCIIGAILCILKFLGIV